MVGQRNVDGDDGGGLRSTLVTHNSFKHLIEGHFLLFFSSRNPNIVSTLERFSFPAKFVQHVVKGGTSLSSLPAFLDRRKRFSRFYFYFIAREKVYEQKLSGHSYRRGRTRVRTLTPAQKLLISTNL